MTIPYMQLQIQVVSENKYTILFVICKEISALQPLENYTTVKYIHAAV